MELTRPEILMEPHMISRFRTTLAKKEAGFTLTELLVVIVIIGILAAVAIPMYLNQQNKAHDAAVKSDITNAALAADAYYVDDLEYPTTAAGFANDNGAPLASPGTSYVAFVGPQNYVIYGKSKSNTVFRYDRSSGDGAQPTSLTALPGTASAPTGDTGVTGAGVPWDPTTTVTP
ncbi:prepilin-type N-terminal cleavage/methylation domain-containing protein [Cellulosimicrobium sp. Marseille-Q4280]|uniref:type IV pilin protein n=1 Tax=Cellulosimicrobium sp. Marseille-Q4280 TaxID=2937992 RepID=UPI0025582EBE|nr:prepilin-type N-terminal cleavage/methylation domain-containing protein [Cellulosimicrobium sp. Marseille-Q4280]